jgi:hypothetical protein
VLAAETGATAVNPLRLGRWLAAPLTIVVFAGFDFYQGHGVQMTFPEGWKTPVKGAGNLVTALNADESAICSIDSKGPGGDGDQELLNKKWDHPFIASEWAGVLGFNAARLTISDDAMRPLGNAYVYVATIAIKGEQGPGSDVTGRFGVVLLPNRVVFANCQAWSSDYDGMSAAFRQAVDSMRPW